MTITYFSEKQIVNHHTYLRGPTSKGTIACVKKLPEVLLKEGAEILIPMGRLTNLKSATGYKIPHSFKNVRGLSGYIVPPKPSQSKQSTKIFRLVDESPKGIFFQKLSEFGIARNTKVWGRRKTHSTALGSGKESSKSLVENNWFEGQFIENQFKRLRNDLERDSKAKNLTTILSNKEFLIGCYVNTKLDSNKYLNMSKKSGFINTNNRFKKETLDGINLNWFEKVCQTFKNGSFSFSPTKKTYIVRSVGKKTRPLVVPSNKDKIIQRGMKILLECVFEKSFRNSSHAFRPGRGCHTALNQIRVDFSKSNWFIKGDIEQQFPTIDHNILINLLREKIKDEPFIDLIYKYLKVGYINKDGYEVKPGKMGLAQGRILSPILSNIYMNHLDAWVEDHLIPKYTSGKKRKQNPEYTKMIRGGRAFDKSIRSGMANDENFGRVYYVRYVDDFFIGVVGSKRTCGFIQSDIKNFLEEKMKLTLNSEKTKITHATTEDSFFLNYRISCTPFKKMRIGYNSKNKLTRFTTNTILTAPTQELVKKLKEKGFLNKKGLPTRNKRYINVDLWNIIQCFRGLERGILNYYSLANNYGRFAARVHYSLKYSCALTIASKMKLTTLRKVFKRYGKDLTINIAGESISYPKISYKRPRKFIEKSANNVDFDKLLNQLAYRIKRHVGHIKGPCVICGCENDIEVHHIKHLKGNKGKDWLAATMSQFARRQVPVCKSCHQKIHKGLYNGPKL